MMFRDVKKPEPKAREFNYHELLIHKLAKKWKTKESLNILKSVFEDIYNEDTFLTDKIENKSKLLSKEEVSLLSALLVESGNVNEYFNDKGPIDKIGTSRFDATPDLVTPENSLPFFQIDEVGINGIKRCLGLPTINNFPIDEKYRRVIFVKARKDAITRITKVMRLIQNEQKKIDKEA